MLLPKSHRTFREIAELWAQENAGKDDAADRDKILSVFYHALRNGEFGHAELTIWQRAKYVLHNATSIMTATITVTGRDDGSVVSNVAYGGVSEGGTAQSFAYNAADADTFDTLTYAVLTQPLKGSVVDNGDGTFAFDPGSDFQDLAANETRQVLFTYQVTDSKGTTEERQEAGWKPVTRDMLDQTLFRGSDQYDELTKKQWSGWLEGLRIAKELFGVWCDRRDSLNIPRRPAFWFGDEDEGTDQPRSTEEVEPEDQESRATVGRPSRREEITTAYEELVSAGEIDFDNRKTATYEPIRKRVRRTLNIATKDVAAGLGDEVIRQVITPLFDRDKTTWLRSHKLS